MQDASEFRTNRDLFSNHYLDEHLRGSDPWQSIDQSTVQEAYDDIMELWERERDLVADRNESQLEDRFIRPMFRLLGIPYEVEETVQKGQRRPDYGFFQSEDAAKGAFERRREGGDFYQNAVAVADAKYWDRKLDTRGERQRDFENPSYQIHVYLQETPTTWAVLTNGRHWRLYYGPTSHRLDSYYEIDLPAVLEDGDLEAFKYFYLFFRHEAFLPDASGDCFLDDVYDESNVFAQELGEDLQDNIYEAIKTLAEGFLSYTDNDLDRDDLDLVHDSSLIYLYRLIFVLYAESEGRDLLNTDNEIYRTSYSLNTIKQEVAEQLDSDQPQYQSWQNNLWNRIDELFQLIDQGSAVRNIPSEDLHIPAYNGGLFRTDPDLDDSREAQFLATYTVGDAYLARVIELLTRSRTGKGGKSFVDYSSLDVRHLGSVYEGLLEYRLNVADEPLTLDDGEYVVAGEDEGSETVVEPDEVYLTTDSGERKATGSYYTPEYVVEYIVENTLEPLVQEIREDLIGFEAHDEGGFAEEFAERVFELKVLDPAMGSGHFLTNTIDYLAREIIDAQERQAEQQGVETVAEGQDINWARRQVAQQCIYGVDLNPLAVELAKVSLWLRTLAAEQPLAFLDHHLKTGNSLVGSDIESIDELETDANGGPNASLAEFGVVHRGTIDHLMEVYEEFIAIENTDLADAKEMERKYREIERDDLRNRLVAMANVKTAEDFDLALPSGAYEQMARALDSEDEWADVVETDWFQSAQAMADERNFLHWKLEFPEVFYEVDGSSRENPGFDAVIGNPPWVITSDVEQREYLWNRYEYQSGQPDLYRFFIECCSQLTKSRFSMIAPSSWFGIPAAAKLREDLIEAGELIGICRVPQSAFDDVDANMATFMIEKGSETDEVIVSELEESGAVNESFILPYEVVHREGHRIPLQWGGEGEESVIQKIQTESIELGIFANTTVGYQLYHTDIHSTSEIENEVYHSKTAKSDSFVPEIRSSSIDEFHVDSEPIGYVDMSAEFFRIPPEPFRVGDRILIREVTGKRGIISAKVTDELLFPKSVISLVVENNEYQTEYLTSLLNSKLLLFEFSSTGEKATQDLFPRLSGSSLKRLSIHEHPKEHTFDPDAVPEILNRVNLSQSLKTEFESTFDTCTNTEALLSEFATLIGNLKSERKSLNLSLPDYLGTYDDGPSLAERYQPPAGLADSILTDTTEERINLKFGRVTVAEDGGKLVIRVTARYKPDNPDEFETDRWGYTETESEPAMEFVGLSDAERALIQVFVPYAVAEGDDFQEKAAKTISPLDRLEALTLPELADVEDGLERYRQTKKRAEELDEKIEKTDELIDQIVYQLYGLTDEEIEIVEEAVADD